MFKIVLAISAFSFMTNSVIGQTSLVQGAEEAFRSVAEVERYDNHEEERLLTVRPRIVAPPPPPTVEELYPMETIPLDWPCREFFHTSIKAGWTIEEWPRLGKIMWRESRCLPDACGETDSPHLRKCRDWGLLQINDYSWKTTIRNMGMNIEQMHDPYWNLWFGRWLFEYSLDRNDDGWFPWKPVKQK